MRPIISTSRNIAGSVLYNEQKVKLKKAERLVASNFLKKVAGLTTEDIIHRFKDRMGLNERVKTCLHITLNFDPQDKIDKEKMTPIIRLYMKEIGFEHQPFVAWGHFDAGHPHCHIVTTHVKPNGDPIDLYKLGQNQSEKARQKIESEFHLVTAEMKKQQRLEEKRVNLGRFPQRVQYGLGSLTRSISDALEYVTKEFRYRSLDDLNTILRHYNIEAYRGQPGSRLYENRGLLYRALDDHGNYIGRPLKASFFDCRPTLDRLEQKFSHNVAYKSEDIHRMENTLFFSLYRNPDNLDDLIDHLRWQWVKLTLRIDKAGNCTEMSAVDFSYGAVVSGKDLSSGRNHEAIQQVIKKQRIREAWEMTHKHELRQSQNKRQSRGLSHGL